VFAGSYGVDVFFAISGILICSRLLAEERIEGRINLKHFYVRRFFRILPPAVLYLLALAVLALAAVTSTNWRELLESLLFCRNYATILHVTDDGFRSWYTGHFWSLSLEEQFYFLLPALLVLSPKRFRASILIAFSCGIVSRRYIVLESRPWDHVLFHADVRLDALLIPAIFAVLASSPTVRQRLKSMLRIWPLLFIAILVLIPVGEGTAWHVTLLNLLMPCLILGAVLNSANVFGKVLEWSVLRYIGRISYSLYLWQQLFFTGHFLPAPAGLWQRFPLNVLLTFTCAILSYYLVEQPMIRLGRRFAPSPHAARPKPASAPAPSPATDQVSA
jgi:peptidoglycan/LPS O-acetylase OafA/YrhL